MTDQSAAYWRSKNHIDNDTVIRNSQFRIRRAYKKYQYEIHLFDDKYRGMNHFEIAMSYPHQQIVRKDITAGFILEKVVRPRYYRRIIQELDKDFIRFITTEMIKEM